jgi:hypothetical protein
VHPTLRRGRRSRATAILAPATAGPAHVTTLYQACTERNEPGDTTH